MQRTLSEHITFLEQKIGALKKQLEEPEQSASQQNETEIDRGIAERALVLRYAHPTQEHQARSVERLEHFNAARQIEALLPDAETAASLIQ